MDLQSSTVTGRVSVFVRMRTEASSRKYSERGNDLEMAALSPLQVAKLRVRLVLRLADCRTDIGRWRLHVNRS